MNISGRLSLRLALIVAFAATLGLTACGRKGPLDPPPSSTATIPEYGPADGGGQAEESQEPGGGALRRTYNRIPLDVLLN